MSFFRIELFGINDKKDSFSLLYMATNLDSAIKSNSLYKILNSYYSSVQSVKTFVETFIIDRSFPSLISGIYNMFYI